MSKPVCDDDRFQGDLGCDLALKSAGSGTCRMELIKTLGWLACFMCGRGRRRHDGTAPDQARPILAPLASHTIEGVRQCVPLFASLVLTSVVLNGGSQLLLPCAIPCLQRTAPRSPSLHQ